MRTARSILAALAALFIGYTGHAGDGSETGGGSSVTFTYSPDVASVELGSYDRQTFSVVASDSSTTYYYAWYKGTSRTGGNAQYTYTQMSTTPVTLKVEVYADRELKSKLDERSWTINPKTASAPSIKNAYPTSPVEITTGEKETFGVAVVDADSGVSYKWYQNDGGAEGFQLISGQTRPTYEYTCSGANVQLKVEVWSSDGKTKHDEATWSVVVKEPTGGGEGGGTGGETIYITGKTPSSASVEMVTGAKQTFSVEINNPAASVRYEWYCGPRYSSTTVIPGATASSYEYECTGAEVNLMVYVLPAEGSGVHEAFTWYITPKEPDPVPTVTGFTPNAANFNTQVGKGVSLNASVENATSDITYVWEMDSTGSGRSFAEISGATGSSYIYRPTSAGTVMIRVTVKNGEGTPLDNGTKTWTITATESTSTMTLSRSSPASESVSMTVGSKQTFVATGSGLDGATLKWFVNGTQKGGGSLSYEFEPTAAGTYTIMCTAVGKSGSKSVSWTVTVSAGGGSGGGEGGGGEGGSTEPFVRKTPATNSLSVDVDTLITFEVEAKDTSSSYGLDWGILKDNNIVTSTASHNTSFAYTFRSAGTYTVTLSYSGAKSGKIEWTVTVGDGGSGGGGSGGGDTPSLSRASPAEENVTIKYGESQTFTVEAKGISNANYLWYVGTSNVGTGLSYTYRPDDPGTTTLICKAISKSGGAVLATVSWTVTANEESGSGGGGTTDLFEKETPLAQSQAMTAGGKMTFSVKANGDTSNYNYFWGFSEANNSTAATLTTNAINALTCEFEPRGDGTFYVTFSYNPKSGGSIKQIFWVVTVTGGSTGGGEGGGGEGGGEGGGDEPVVENDYIAVPMPADTMLGNLFTHLATLPEGAFEKPVKFVSSNTPRCYSNFALKGALPAGVGLSIQDGVVVLSGTMNDDLDGETIAMDLMVDTAPPIVVTRTNCVELTLVKRRAEDTTPYLGYADPADDEVDAYIGIQTTFTAFAYDEEGAALTYNWYLDGNPTAYNSTFMNLTDNDESHVGSTHTVNCTASDGSTGETLLKTWTVTMRQPRFKIETDTLPGGTAGNSMDSIEIKCIKPGGTSVVALDVIYGAMPLGWTPFSNGYIDGAYRKGGSYTFTLRATCSNGETDEKTYTVDVGGTEAVSPRTWKVQYGVSPKALSANGGAGNETTVYSITMALQQGACAGDTIEYYSAYPSAVEDTAAFKYMQNIDVRVKGELVLEVADRAPDVSMFTKDGGSINIVVEPKSEGKYAETVLIAKIGAGRSAEDFTITGVSAPYYGGGMAIDEDGWLYTRCACVRATQTTDRLNLPDDINRRDVVFNGATFQRTVLVSSEGVLPGSITFEGANTFGGSFDLANVKEVKTIVKTGAKLVFAGGSLGNSKLSGIEFEPGSTLEFNPNSQGAFVLGTRMTLPAEGKINLSLTAPLEVGKTCTIIDRYVGDDDLQNVFNIIRAAGDETAYRLYCGAENTLVLAAEETPDAGEFNWEDDLENLPGATAGSAFSYSFKARGPKETNPRTGEESDAYHNFTYSLVNPAYTMSRERLNTFDETAGTQELLQGAYRAGASSAATDTEIGFPFPCGTNFVSTVKVWCAGRLKVGDVMIALCDKGLLADVSSTFAHVYVERSSDKFTIRYARFASVTLTPNGKIRVAFGPDADLPSVADPQHPLCYMTRGNEMVDFTSAESYADAKDVVLSPSCPPGLALTAGGVLSGRAILAGEYPLTVKVTAQDSSNTYGMTRTFYLNVTDSGVEAPVIGVEGPKTWEDGYVHLDLGAEAEFTASVAEGNQLRWTLDGEVVGETASYKLTAPATRSLNATGARIHRLAAEADDASGRWNWSARHVWYVVYNRKVYVDASAVPSLGGGEGGAAGGGDGGAAVGGVVTGGDGAGGVTTGGGATMGGGTSAADGLTSETAFKDFPKDVFKYLLNGDEVIVAEGNYVNPVDFLNNDAAVTIRATGAMPETVIGPIAGDGSTRCFRQGRYELDYGASGTLELIFKPVQNAVLDGFAVYGGYVESDPHNDVYLFRDSSVECYGVVGGGVFGGDVRNCYIADCHAKDYGGGAYGAKLSHCVLEGNAADFGGGCANSEATYCTIVENIAAKAAGGIDGQSSAASSIVVGNKAAGKASEYAATTTPTHLVPYVPTIVDSFTSGDPLFCAWYHLASGSPAEGKGAYPTPDASECLVFVEIEGGGMVFPSSISGVPVKVGDDREFEVYNRDVIAVYVNGEPAENPVDGKWTLSNVTANTTVRFVFAPGTLEVGPGRKYETITDAICDARSGDIIKVDGGTYEETLDLFAELDDLTIEAADPDDKPIVDAKGSGRCVTAMSGAGNIVFRNIVFVNGLAQIEISGDQPYAEWLTDGTHSYDDYELLGYGFGGGVFGGRYEYCVISNCTARGSKGGGAFGATLVGCEIACNKAGEKDSSVNLRDMCGGGAFGGLVKDCRVHGNSLVGYQNQIYCRYRGAGTFGAEVRNSFVWENFINCGSVESAIPSETHVGTDGVTVHTVEKAPTPAQLENHRTPIPVDGETPTYATRADAEDAAAKQVADIPTPVARTISNHDAYVNLFEIRTVEDGKGGFVNKPALKEPVLETIHEQAMDALTTDDSGEPRESFQVQKMEKTLTNTIPGLYYALEFSSDMGAGTFVGERHLATGSGSVKLSATSLNTPSGFWRMAVYLTPDGE